MRIRNVQLLVWYKDVLQMMDFVPLIVQYVNLSIPNEQRNSQLFNTSLAEEFYNSQVRALTFLGYIARNSVVSCPESSDSFY